MLIYRFNFKLAKIKILFYKTCYKPGLDTQLLGKKKLLKSKN